ncbi:MAG: 4Fe-4S binding protein [Candidatus Scalindua rubra]|uniref:Putative nitrite and sulphite reductase n=1 Tax=Candidatus Scalindua brodae TaxID=237368 RepID=A0A0B0ERT0_9BACT|nr:MAG: putative nitrite and sulphite reductase [Candidatus Scalindua brodae]MBZ0110715.1 4Fe-4S binding protein [Candidatus Scalindua rubra]
MEWDEEASLRLGKIPIFVQRMARSKIEKCAREKGKSIVTLEDVEDAKAGFMGTGSVKSDKGVINANPLSLDSKAGEDKFEILKRSKEYEEEDGSPTMYTIEICRGEDVECPFLIAGIKGIRQKMKDRLKEIGFSKKLISRINGKILPHQRLKIAIASCPNCCSMPQIKDFGVHVRATVSVHDDFECNGCGNCLRACKEGAIRITGMSNKQSENGKKVVTINYDRCVHCGLCAEVCPTGTIKTEKKCYRVMIGGKLGRHPRFADDLIDFADESEVLKALDVCVDALLNEKKEKRFGELVRKIGIEEFKRRLNGNKDLSREHVSDKEIVHAEMHN